MNQSELEQASQAGQIEQVKSEQSSQSQDAPLFDMQIDMTAYQPLLASLLSPRKYLSAVPTFVPKNFLEQIQIVDDATGVYLYIYFTNSGWQYSKLSETNSTKLKIVAAPVTIQNSTSEINIFSFTLPANKLGTNNAVRAKVYAGFATTVIFRNTSDTLTIRGYYGSTTFAFPPVVIGSGSGSYAVEIDFCLVANGATNSQTAVINVRLFEQNVFANNLRQGYFLVSEAFAVDSTIDQTFKLTGQWSVASTSNRFIVDSSIVDLVK